jgi:hypothetical protein
MEKLPEENENESQAFEEISESVIGKEAEPSKKSSSKKIKLPKLQYADGKARDEIDTIEDMEKVHGADKLSPFKTSNVQVFKRNLENMSREKMTALAHRVAARVYSSEEDQRKELLKAFVSWSSTNGFSQTSSTNQKEKGALSAAFEGAENIDQFYKLIKKKSLSDLQSTASQLGFKPSFERSRLIDALLKEYHRQAS